MKQEDTLKLKCEKIRIFTDFYYLRGSKGERKELKKQEQSGKLKEYPVIMRQINNVRCDSKT